MEEFIDERIYYSKKICAKLKELITIFITAVIISFLVNILANSLFNYVIGESLTYSLLITIGVAFFFLVIFSYFLYKYVLEPYSSITTEIRIPIIYNKKDCTVIDDPFDGYLPQKMAWQAFQRFKEKYPDIAKNRISEGIPPDITKKHILTELLEYLIVLNLKENLSGFDKRGLMPDKTIVKLPNQLENNSFISFFRSLEPKDMVDRGMSQLELNLPKDVEIKYWSPVPIEGLIPDFNTFKIGFVGKYCEIYLIGRCTSLWHIQSMSSGPAPIFEGVYVRPYFQEELIKNLSNLWRITFYISVEAKFKLRTYLFPPLAYIEWTERLIEGLIKGTFFSSFDFEGFRKEKQDSMEYDLYETIKMIDVRTEDIGKEISNMKKS